MSVFAVGDGELLSSQQLTDDAHQVSNSKNIHVLTMFPKKGSSNLKKLVLWLLLISLILVRTEPLKQQGWQPLVLTLTGEPVIFGTSKL